MTQKTEIEYLVSETLLAKSCIHPRAAQWPARHKFILVIIIESGQVFWAPNWCHLSWPPLVWQHWLKEGSKGAYQIKVLPETDMIHLVTEAGPV